MHLKGKNVALQRIPIVNIFNTCLLRFEVFSYMKNRMLNRIR